MAAIKVVLEEPVKNMEEDNNKSQSDDSSDKKISDDNKE